MGCFDRSLPKVILAFFFNFSKDKNVILTFESSLQVLSPYHG